MSTRRKNIHDTAAATARRHAREAAESVMHLPLERARKKARALGRSAGHRAVQQTIPPEEKGWSGDGNDGYTFQVMHEVGTYQALRTLYAAKQPAVSEAPIVEEETRSVSLEIALDDDEPEGKEPEDYISERGISEKLFHVPVWSHIGLALEMMTPWVEGQPAVKRLGPNAKRYGEGHVEVGHEAYVLGYMTRSMGGGTHFQALLKGSHTLGGAKAFVAEHGSEALQNGSVLVRGWNRLLAHLGA